MKKTILTAGVVIVTLGLAFSASSPAHAAAAPWQASWIGISKSSSDAELPEIVVAKALYGVRGDPTKQVDLTASIRQNMADGNFTLRADNATAGRDPAHGAEKILELDYTINGRPVRQSLKENTTIDLVTGQMATNQNKQQADKPPVGSNQWICYRKTIHLAEAPTQAVARIAVDSKYWLWINGEPVVIEGQLKRGPTPNDTYFDRVDLTKHLRQGDNTIAVLVWYFGKEGFSHKSSGKAGLVFDAEINGQPFLSGPDWKARLHPAFENTGEPHPNFRLPESNIRFDARKDLANWQIPAFDDASWPAAVVFGKPPCAPWNQLVERPIPQWKDFGLKDYVNATDLPKVSDGQPIKAKLPYNAQITPYLKIESPAGQVIDLRMDNYGQGPTVRAEYVTREGVQEYENLGWMNGHEVHYTIPAGIKILALKYRETGYDTAFTGTFECDDDFLNRYREKALRTLYVNMRDTYMDCPERERAQWWGDVVNMMGQTFYSLAPDSSRLIQKAIFELMNWQGEDLIISSPVPAGNWDHELPLQMLNSVGYFGFWNYYLNTGDIETIRAVYPRVKSYLSIWKIGENGLVVQRGQRLWIDHGPNKDLPVLFSAWYYLALRGQKLMAEALGETADLPAIEAGMKSIEENFNKTFWTGTEYRSPGYKDETDERGHALAVLSGLAGPDKYEAIRKVFATQEHSSPYMEKYVGEALYKMRFEDDAIARTKKRFKEMVEDPGTTLWEIWDRGTKNHSWGGGALTLLSQYGAGVAPVTPGYATYHVLPQMGSLKRIKTIVPSVKGKIAVELRNEPAEFSLDLVSPKDTIAIVGIPKRNGTAPVRITINGQRVWENGKSTGTVDGVAFKANEEHYSTFTVQPGAWAFRAEFSPAAQNQ
jgi:alpha-L-rhamnosidase